MSNIKYRPDIDGLRAFAVLAVILFHFNNSFLTGGFIGVDIFFVISGFIITLAIFPDIEKRQFSFSDFYYRRIKRILPLVYFVSFCVIVYAFYIFTPKDFVGVADSVRYSSGFISNILFDKRSGYFTPASETIPLLHTWSLSIEEQFYLVFPIVLIGLTKIFKLKGLLISLFLTLICLTAYSQYSVNHDPVSAYFLIQNRGFELLVGAILAILIKKNKLNNLSENALNTIGVISFGVLVGFYFVFNKTYGFPGIFALIVSIATAGVILSGFKHTGFVYYLLKSKPLVYIGKISFSLYLWHWIVIAFYRYQFETFDLLGYVLSTLLIVGLSLFSYYFIEQPLRYNRYNIKQTITFFFFTPIVMSLILAKFFVSQELYLIVVFGFLTGLIILFNYFAKSNNPMDISKRSVYLFYFLIPLILAQGVSRVIDKTDGLPQRFNEKGLAIYKYSTLDFDDLKTKDNPLFKMNDSLGIDRYIIGDVNEKEPTAIIWGDSHAGHLRGAFDALGKQYHKSFIYAGTGGCPPVIGLMLERSVLSDNECYDINNNVIKFIKNSNIKNVIIAGRWAMYSETTRSKNESGRLVYSGDATDESKSIENSRRVLTSGLHKTIQTLKSYGKNIIMFGQIPEFEFVSNNCLFKNEVFKRNENCDMPVKDIKQRQKFITPLLTDIQNKYPNVIFIDPSKYFCNKDECLSVVNGVPIYKDDDHLNTEGAKMLINQYLKDDSSQRFKSILF